MTLTIDRTTDRPRAAGAGARARRDGFVFVLVLVARTYRSLLLTLVTVALLPAVSSWTGYVVRTGSMEPSIEPGDVIVGQPFGAGELVPVGRVMVFEAPPGSGAGPVLRVHRVVGSLGHGRYTTAGDANPTPDAAPVPRANFRSRAVIRVPYVGLPLVWLHDREPGRMVLWLLGTMALLRLSFRRVDGDPPRRGGGRRRGVRVAVVAGVAATAVAGPTAADAAFSATTVSHANTWRASSLIQQPYTAAVKADAPYGLYRLDEASGTTAADTSGYTRTGTYTGVAAYRQTGALPNNPGYSIGLAAANGRMVGGGTALSDPTTFSVELWFRTTTTAGGKLIGFENTQGTASTSYDREALMTTDGKVTYLGGSNTTTKPLVSPTALNNGAWHHLVITSVPAGTSETAAMYVDGVLVSSGTVTKAATVYTGWWRVGFGKLPYLSLTYPLTGNFTGSIDDVAVYTTALSAARVAAHYAAR